MKIKIRFLVFLLLFSIMLFPAAAASAEEASVLTCHFLDVGQGFCTLLISDGHAMLLDGGGRESSSFVVAYLKEHGIDHLDYLVTSHFDEDHIAGLIGVLKTAKVDAVIQPAYEADTKIYRSLLRAEEETGVPVLIPQANPTRSNLTGTYFAKDNTVLYRAGIPCSGTATSFTAAGASFAGTGSSLASKAATKKQENARASIPLGTPIPLGSAFFTFLGPASYAHDVENDNSLVLRASCGKRHFLFPGDAEAAAEGELLSGGLPLRADVLAVGHHGSTTSTTDAFLTAVQPKIAVISCGKNNPYGPPAKQTLDRLKALGTEILRTDLSGTIVLSTDGKTIQNISEIVS